MCETTLYCIAFRITLLTELRQSIRDDGPFHCRFSSESRRLPPGTLFRDVIHYLGLLSASIIVHLSTESLGLLTCPIRLISSPLMELTISWRKLCGLGSLVNLVKHLLSVILQMCRSMCPDD